MLRIRVFCLLACLPLGTGFVILHQNERLISLPHSGSAKNTALNNRQRRQNSINESPKSEKLGFSWKPLVSTLSIGFGLTTFALPSAAKNLIASDLEPRFFLAGALCAAISHGITTPIDVVKTRMQADPYRFKQGDVGRAAIQIVRDDGISVLLGGLGPTVVGYGIEGAAKFGLYESLKPLAAHAFALDNPAIPYLLASTVAGAVASLILCPMERVRIRLVTEPGFATNFLTGVPRMMKESKVGGLFYGLTAMLSKQVPYTAGKQISFDWFAALLYSVTARFGFSEQAVQFEVSVGAAALASVLACIMSHPGDVILTNSYRDTSNRSFLQNVSAIYEKDGLNGFLSGIWARFLHVGVIITSQLVLYDEIKQLLGLPATGAS